MLMQVIEKWKKLRKNLFQYMSWFLFLIRNFIFFPRHGKIVSIWKIVSFWFVTDLNFESFHLMNFKNLLLTGYQRWSFILSFELYSSLSSKQKTGKKVFKIRCLIIFERWNWLDTKNFDIQQKLRSMSRQPFWLGS